MALLRVNTGFENMTESKLTDKATAIHAAISSNTTTFATPSPSMPDLLDALTAFDDAVATLKAGGGGTKAQVDEKNNLKLQLVNMLNDLAYYVMFIAKSNRNIALQSGYSIAKEPTPKVLTKPQAPIVEASNQPGKMTVKVKRVPGARVYLHQYTTVEQPTEESWMSMNCTTAKCTLEGLKTGTMYYFRIGVIGPKDQTLFSDVVNRLAA